MAGLTSSHGPRGVNIVRLAGGFAGNAPVLRTELIDALGRRGPRLVLDLTAVTSCDEPIVRVVEEANARAWRRGGWLRLAGAPACVVQCIEAIYGRGGPTMYGSVAEAVEGSSEAAPRPSAHQ